MHTTTKRFDVGSKNDNISSCSWYVDLVSENTKIVRAEQKPRDSRTCLGWERWDVKLVEQSTLEVQVETDQGSDSVSTTLKPLIAPAGLEASSVPDFDILGVKLGEKPDAVESTLSEKGLVKERKNATSYSTYLTPTPETKISSNVDMVLGYDPQRLPNGISVGWGEEILQDHVSRDLDLRSVDWETIGFETWKNGLPKGAGKRGFILDFGDLTDKSHHIRVGFAQNRSSMVSRYSSVKQSEYFALIEALDQKYGTGFVQAVSLGKNDSIDAQIQIVTFSPNGEKYVNADISSEESLGVQNGCLFSSAFKNSLSSFLKNGRHLNDIGGHLAARVYGCGTTVIVKVEPISSRETVSFEVHLTNTPWLAYETMHEALLISEISLRRSLFEANNDNGGGVAAPEL